MSISDIIDGSNDRHRQMLDIFWGEVSQIGVFGMVPNQLDLQLA